MQPPSFLDGPDRDLVPIEMGQQSLVGAVGQLFFLRIIQQLIQFGPHFLPNDLFRRSFRFGRFTLSNQKIRTQQKDATDGQRQGCNSR